MSAVVIDPDGREVERLSAPPHRVRLPRAAVDRLAELVGTPSPVTQMSGCRAVPGTGERLGTSVRDGEPSPTPDEDVDGVLAAAGLADSGAPTDHGRAVLAVWHAPTLAVELEVLVELRSGTVRVHSRHRTLAGCVVCLSTADGDHFELSWLAADAWWLEIARAAHVDTCSLRPVPDAEAVPDVFETPWELLLATGEAVRGRRHDLLDQLVADHSGTTLAGASTDRLHVADDTDVRRWHERLETAACGRLHAAVLGRSGRGRPGAGVAEWVLLRDGWRSLTPFARDGRDMVRIRRREPADLPGELAVRAAGVTS
ncbi:MAG TPA: hypothetical protein VLA70_04090 [Nocardioides sp.]|nr:hypothetical protein [Nocardioides sp.]